MSALICGSYAYDTIMVFNDRFQQHILPDQVHMLNVSFLVPELRREFGGCAGNVAYNLKMLGGEGYGMGAVGHDFGPYAEWLDRNDISRRFLVEIPDAFTAQAYITTDVDDNQITAFHPGAMNFSHNAAVPDDAGITVGMISPDGRAGMIQHAAQFAEAGIPFVFDPGQGLPMFDGESLHNFIELANWVALNSYEAALLCERTGLTIEQVAERCEAVVVTAGGNGSKIYSDGQCVEVPAAPVETVADPTGCGDAYRAGLLYGLMNDLDWEITGRIASLMGAMKIEHHGTQNHTFTRDEFDARYQKAFGSKL
ncbi:MAG: carbohydrate kinase family protein [Xanthomonadaceae bacterium]|nr:carbohydrate kinase family protein [Xanthomonadaceae bacterium]